VALVQGSGKVLKLNALSIVDNGVLDLTDHRMVLTGDAGSRAARLASVTAGVVKARSASAGRWTGNGITSSTAVGKDLTGVAVVLNDNGSGGALLTDFGGAPVGANDVLVKLTYNGDANLDGRINADDYFRIDSGFLAKLAKPNYRDGDFNYDAKVNGDDYFLIDSAFLGQGAVLGDLSPTPSAAAAAATVATPEEQKKAARKVRAPAFSTVPVAKTVRRASAR
jgi:hypothetical protein